MEHIESRYKGEIRDGFYIRPMMKRVWAVQLDILREIDMICTRHKLKWYVDWGTLLGAVRSRGYIPWDDDVDISMRRMDFELFKRYAARELPKDYHCSLDRNQELGDLVFNVRKGQGINLDEEYLNQNHGCPYTVGVDVFVYDNIPDDPVERESYVAMFTYTFAAAADLTREMLYDECNEESKEMIMKAEEMTGIHLDRTKPVKGALVSLADQIAAMYYDVETEDIAMTCYLPHNMSYAFPKVWFADVVYLPFEGVMVPAPIAYKEVLQRWFGDDYMTPREYYDHDYPYFAAQEKRLFEYFAEKGLDIPERFKE